MIDLPPAIRAWIEQEHKQVDQLRHMSIDWSTRRLSQEETGNSHYRQYEHTGLCFVSLKFADHSIISKIFSQDELQAQKG